MQSRSGVQPRAATTEAGDPSIGKQHGVTRVLSKFAAVRQLLELDIGPGRLQAHSAKQKRLLMRQRNRLHDRHRAPLGAGGFE